MSARDELRGTLSNTICNESFYPSKAQVHLLGGDMSAVLDKTADSIIAAGYVKVSEAAIERAAKAMQEPWSSRPWDQLSEDGKDVYRDDVRAVIAAPREGA